MTAFLAHYFPNLHLDQIAIDGKTARGSRGGFDQGVHNLTAFATQSKLVLLHLAVDRKTNEIRVIPDMLADRAIENSLITIDAMGCRREIAQLIIDKKADYILALKGNQGNVLKDMQDLLPSMLAYTEDYHVDRYEETEPNSTRIETRKVTITDNQEFRVK